MTNQRTPLYNEHLKLKAQIVPFAGWEMPVSYSGIIAEHNACRQSAGLFDVSHMGEILITGDFAEETLQYLCCNDLSKIKDGQAQYSAFLNQQGGVVDDLIIYRFNSTKFLLCVNASNADNDYQWMLDNNKFKADILNLSNFYGQIAIQGPKAEAILTKLFPTASELKYFHFLETNWLDRPILIARTGYTGEDGFEVYLQAEHTAKLWTELLKLGGTDITPCGLGARDTLRLEAAYPLHGHELTPDTPALSSGLAWIIKFNKANFIGKDALVKYKETNYRKLTGLELLEPGIAREGTKVFNNADVEIGHLTSGTKTPTLNKAIALGIIEDKESQIGNEVFLDIRGRKVKAKITKLPFYQRPSN